MSVSADVLTAKIRAFYPEIARNELSMQVVDDPAKKAWSVVLTKGKHTLNTYVEYADAEGCLAGRECVHLSHQIGQFIQNYCGGACPA